VGRRGGEREGWGSVLREDLFAKVSCGGICKNNSNIEFSLLRIELKFNVGIYMKNIRT